jgi:predicted transposase/invertase (TIGR01784 family)
MPPKSSIPESPEKSSDFKNQGGRTAIITVELEKTKNKRPMVNELVKTEEGIAMAAATLHEFTPEQIEYFRETSRLKYRMDYNTDLAEARDEGREEGSLKKQLEIARNFKALGLAPDQIASGTGLPLEAVKKL